MSLARTRKLLGVKAAAPVLGATLLLGTAACSESEGPDEGTSLQDIQGDEGASEEEIAEAPNEEESQNEGFFQEGDTVGFFEDQESFIDEPVTVSGKIVEVFNQNAFVIGEGDQATLVTRQTTDNMLEIEPGQVAQVSGTVGTFVLVDVEKELGVDFDDQDFNPFESGPYIPAENVNLLDSEGAQS